MSTIRKSRTGVTMGQACWSLYRALSFIFVAPILALVIVVPIVLSSRDAHYIFSYLLIFLCIFAAFAVFISIPSLLFALLNVANPDRTGALVATASVDVKASVIKKAIGSGRRRGPLWYKMPKNRWIRLPSMGCEVRLSPAKGGALWLPRYYLFIRPASDNSSIVTLISIPEFKAKYAFLEKPINFFVGFDQKHHEENLRRAVTYYGKYAERQSIERT